MKTKVPDGMYAHEGITITPENRDSPEVKAYMEERAEQHARRQDPYRLIAEYRSEADSVMAELAAKHDRPELREAIGWPAGVGIAIDDNDPNRDHVLRRWDDLNDVKRYAAKVEDAMKAHQWKTAIANAMFLGISAHKAFRARPLEPEVLSDRAMQEVHREGGPKGAAARKKNLLEFENKFKPLYQRRVDFLTSGGELSYTKAAATTATEFRDKDGDRRHTKRRVMELASNTTKLTHPRRVSRR